MVTFKNRNKAILLLLCSIFLLGMKETGSIPQDPTMYQRAKAALQRYLDVDCEVGEKNTALAQLLTYKEYLPTFQEIFVRLLKEGPDPETRQVVKDALEYNFKQRQAFLETAPDLGLGKKDMEILRSVTKEEFVERGLQNFVRQYREKAALGLAALGNPEGLEALREASETPDLALRRVIMLAMKKYHGERGYQGLGMQSPN